MVSLIFSIAFYSVIPLIPTLIFIISFLLLALGLVFYFFLRVEDWVIDLI